MVGDWQLSDPSCLLTAAVSDPLRSAAQCQRSSTVNDPRASDDPIGDEPKSDEPSAVHHS
ncbi:hypothetical protein RRSWK_04190 [Rhodopirellula sp. SWK7]|nr:hypothetical protein RRSWK_04190 [Rhodopirellula sp. SWK7]